MQNVPQPIDLVNKKPQPVDQPMDTAWDEQAQKEYAEWAAYNDAQFYGEQ